MAPCLAGMGVTGGGKVARGREVEESGREGEESGRLGVPAGAMAIKGGRRVGD